MKALPDITEYYSNETNEIPHNQYKRKFEVEIEVLGQCDCCESLLTSETEIIVDGVNQFCGKDCMNDFQEMMEDGEI